MNLPLERAIHGGKVRKFETQRKHEVEWSPSWWPFFCSFSEGSVLVGEFGSLMDVARVLTLCAIWGQVFATPQRCSNSKFTVRLIRTRHVNCQPTP